MSVLMDNRAIIDLGTPHSGQLAAHVALKGHRFKAVRCGRRFGKTEFAKHWLLNSALRGLETGWFSPQHRISTEVFAQFASLLRPIAKI